MYALLAGCHNVGIAVAAYNGAFLLDRLGVQPRGADNESNVFEHLWIAAIIQAIAPALTLTVLPYMIPNARQTDRILQEDVLSATAGSPWERWTGRDRQRRHREAAEAYGSC